MGLLYGFIFNLTENVLIYRRSMASRERKTSNCTWA